MNLAESYLRLLNKSIRDTLWIEITGEYLKPVEKHFWGKEWSKFIKFPLIDFTEKMGWRLHRVIKVPVGTPSEKILLPARSLSLLSSKALENISDCVKTVIEEGVAGDVIETGVFKGGASIYMAGALMAYGDTTRLQWVADSFKGLPPVNAEKYPADIGDGADKLTYLMIAEDIVRHNFQCFGLLHDRIRFLKGYFHETLPTAPIDKLAIARLDGDMYQSTMDALVNLYDKLSPGGFLIVDDYALDRCRAAVEDFRRERHITEEIIPVDESVAFWRKKF